MSSGSFPGQKAEAENKLVFLAQSHLLLAGGEKIGVNPVNAFPFVVRLRPRQPVLLDVVVPCFLNIGTIFEVFRTGYILRLTVSLLPCRVFFLSRDFGFELGRMILDPERRSDHPVFALNRGDRQDRFPLMLDFDPNVGVEPFLRPPHPGEAPFLSGNVLEPKHPVVIA